MTALTCDRNTPKRTATRFRDPVASGRQIFAGAILSLDGAGNAIQGCRQPGCIPRGMALTGADNRLGDGAYVEVEAGCFGVKTDGTVGRQHIGHDVYLMDDQTVTSAGSGQGGAVTLIDLEGEGYDAVAWVKVGC